MPLRSQTESLVADLNNSNPCFPLIHSIKRKNAYVRRLPVNETHGVYSIQSQHHLSCVKTSPLLWYIVITHQVNQITARHVLHNHVEVAIILECKEELKSKGLQ